MSQTLDLGSSVALLRKETGSGLVRRPGGPSAPVCVYLGIDPAVAQLGVCCRSTAARSQHKDLPSGSDSRPARTPSRTTGRTS